MSFNHEQIGRLSIVPDEEGCYFGLVTDQAPRVGVPGTLVEAHMLFMGDSVDPIVHHLITAAPQMYRQLSHQYKILQDQIDALESIMNQAKREQGRKLSLLSHLVAVFIEMQDLILLTQRIALEGADPVAKDLFKGA